MSQKLEEPSWWIEILVDGPACIYYFGNFDSYQEAELSKNRYIQDLQEEGAEPVATRIGQYNPEEFAINLNNIFVRSKLTKYG